MPETPDFEARAIALIDDLLLDLNMWGTHGAPGEHKIRILSTAITEQLRLVWNARGAADIEKVILFDEAPAKITTSAIRKLDR